jgi:hypothetical protein
VTSSNNAYSQMETTASHAKEGAQASAIRYTPRTCSPRPVRGRTYAGRSCTFLGAWSTPEDRAGRCDAGRVPLSVPRRNPVDLELSGRERARQRLRRMDPAGRPLPSHWAFRLQFSSGDLRRIGNLLIAFRMVGATPLVPR